MSNKQEAAKKIANEVLKRRRDAQYAAMLEWKNGKITGIQCIEKIEDLSKMIFVEKTDFQPQKEKEKPTKDKA